MRRKLLNTTTRSMERILRRSYPVHKFVIDCADLPKEFDEIKFNRLNLIDTPCLYWFEAKSKAIATKLKGELEGFRNSKSSSGRTIPVANSNQDSKVIYVGERHGGITKKTGKSNIRGRILIHLGYYQHGTTQGLQLKYWAKELLYLYVLELTADAKPFLNTLEKLLAMELKPICGQH